jgi:hypothetical protein
LDLVGLEKAPLGHNHLFVELCVGATSFDLEHPTFDFPNFRKQAMSNQALDTALKRLENVTARLEALGGQKPALPPKPSNASGSNSKYKPHDGSTFINI